MHKHYKKHAYSNILKILPPKNENFRIKNSDVVLISAQNIDCGYSLEPPQHTCDNFMMTMREICFSDEGDWSLNEGDFLTTCSSSFSYQFHMV